MTEKSPHAARARTIYSHNGEPTTIKAKLIEPGTFSDGQHREGTKPENIHNGEHPPYAHPQGHEYREQLRARPSAKPHKGFKST